ncbi:F-box protein At1g20360-like [Lycium barbarum]|uniref:F-box protein At1g20360-like n=1 Tax=Lycium barbarum TaxID=112863 RepID=UPI00293EC68F|nr:F-box protein At1g20360-like [Lycium barbarum]
MELNEDLIMDIIISRLPLKLAVQCKVLSKSFNNKLCEPSVTQSFASRWFQDQNISKLVIYSSPSPPSQSWYKISNYFRKVSSNNPSHPRGEISTTSRLNVSLLASCKGLLLLEYHQFKTFCIFNPITGVHQLIPYPKPRIYFSTRCGGAGLAVDHPTSSRYKLVIVEILNNYQGYKFRVFSSEEGGVMWHEFQLRMEFCSPLDCQQPSYVHDCLHWLTSNGDILAFDTKSSTGDATIIKHPEVYKLFKDPMYGVLSLTYDAMLGLARGVLTVVCAFEKFIVVFGYDYVSRNWTVSYTIFSSALKYLGGPGLPICFGWEKLLFLRRHRYLYEIDSEMKTYKKVGEVLGTDGAIFFPFEPTLARVPKTVLPPYTVHSKHFPFINATLGELRCLIANRPLSVSQKPP